MENILTTWNALSAHHSNTEAQMNQSGNHIKDVTIFIKTMYSKRANHVVDLYINLLYQWGRLQIFDYWVFSDRKVKLVSTEDETMVNRVSYQVYASSHDKGDDAEVNCWARKSCGTALNQLQNVKNSHV